MKRSARPRCGGLLSAVLVLSVGHGWALISRGIIEGTPMCECSCCEVGAVPPSQQTNGMGVVCSPAFGEQGEGCPEQCIASPPGKPKTTPPPKVSHLQSLFGASNDFEDAGDEYEDEQKGEVVVYAGFCLSRCLPERSEHLGATCKNAEEVGPLPPLPPPETPPPVPKAPKEKPVVADLSDGDAAAFAAPELDAQILPPDQEAELEAAEASDGEAMAKAAAEATMAAAEEADQSPAEAEMESQEEIKETGALAAQAAGYVATASSFEARASEAEAMSNRALANSTDNLQAGINRVKMANDVHKQLKEASIQAGIYARSAKASAARAEAELQQMRAIPGQAAAEATRIAIAELQRKRDFNMKTIQDVENVKVPKQEPMSESAERAASPYRNALRQQQSSMQAYRYKAQQLEDYVDQLQDQALKLDKLKAKSSDPDTVQLKIRDLMRQAEAADVQAQSDYETADKIGATLPRYQAQADAVRSRADIISRERWMPPAIQQSHAAPLALAGPAPGPAPASAFAQLRAHRERPTTK